VASARPQPDGPPAGTPRRRSLALVTAAGLLLVAWGFVLGVLVGRGTVPTIVRPNQPSPPLAQAIIPEPESPTTTAAAPTAPSKEPNLEFFKELKQKQAPVTALPPALPRQTPGQAETAERPAIPPSKASKSKPAPPEPETPAKAEPIAKPAKTEPAAKPVKAEPPAKPDKTEPAAKTAKAEPSPAPPPDKPGYSLQVAAFKDRSEAESFARQVEPLTGLKARVVSADLKEKGTWYRVRLGNFATRAEAVQKAAELRAKNLKSMIQAPGS